MGSTTIDNPELCVLLLGIVIGIAMLKAAGKHRGSHMILFIPHDFVHLTSHMIVHYKQRYFFHHSFDCVSEVSHLDSLALCFTPRSSELWMHLHLVHHRSRWAPMLGRKAAVQALENQPFGEVKQELCFPVNWGVTINEVRIVLSAYLPQQCFRDCPIGF
jgi:hypothetical protein